MSVTLPLRADLEAAFGAANIAQWCDVDGTENAQLIDARATWGIQRGYNWIVAKLDRRFAISQITTTLPAIVFELITDRAGIEVYRSPRGIVDGDPAFQMINSASLRIESYVEQLQTGAMDLTDIATPPTDTIAVVCADDIPGNREFVHAMLRIDKYYAPPYGNMWAPDV